MGKPQQAGRRTGAAQIALPEGQQLGAKLLLALRAKIPGRACEVEERIRAIEHPVRPLHLGEFDGEKAASRANEGGVEEERRVQARFSPVGQSGRGLFQKAEPHLLKHDRHVTAGNALTEIPRHRASIKKNASEPVAEEIAAVDNEAFKRRVRSAHNPAGPRFMIFPSHVGWRPQVRSEERLLSFSTILSVE